MFALNLWLNVDYMEIDANPKKERIDLLLFNKNLVKSRSAAQALIKRGVVFCNGQKVLKASDQFPVDSSLTITKPLPYVGRGGEKLAGALKSFSLDLSGQVVLDIGSSTGGFTDCALQHGAKRVVAVDVGTLQFDEALKKDSRIELHEQTDIRNFVSNERFNTITIDVSFISLTEVLAKAQELLAPQGNIIALIKPQFEVGKDGLSRKGIVKDTKLLDEAVYKIKRFASQLGLEVKQLIPSPIQGGDGNQEFLAHIAQNQLPGIHTVWKPVGPSSNQFLNQLRRTLNKKKIGHAGTLDPLAEGILVIGIDREGTKLLDSCIKQNKEYLAEIFLGAVSETDDREGPVVEVPTKNAPPSREEIEKTLKELTGVISQTPPKYSALKINGKPAYERVRNGEVVNLTPRKVEIFNIEVIDYRFPTLTIKVTCGSGTYIRTLSRDIGEKLGTGAYLASLTRTRVGNFSEKTLWDFPQPTK